MKPFRYVCDPLFLTACALYALNRWWVKPRVEAALFQNWFNDALLIPCALPIVLMAQRWLGLRTHDRPPTAGEMAGHLAGWSLLFEVIGPAIARHATGDPADVLAYAVGGALATCWWRRTARV